MRAFWRYPLCHGSTGKSGSCSGTLQNTVTVTTMSVEGRNAHLTPHTRHCASCWHVRLMGNDPLSNRIWVHGPQCAPLLRPAKNSCESGWKHEFSRLFQNHVHMKKFLQKKTGRKRNPQGSLQERVLGVQKRIPENRNRQPRLWHAQFCDYRSELAT